MGKKILVVDDEVHICKIIRYALEHENFDVIVGIDGKEGLKMAREESPDLIILDLMLPNIDGFKICRLLKFDERYRQIPIILLSARSNAQDRELGKQVGADLFMAKPFDPEELARNVKDLLTVGSNI